MCAMRYRRFMRDGVSVIMPALNEEKNLPAAVRDAVTILKRAVKSYEVIIVNDGSFDKTGDVAEVLAKKYAHIQVLHNRENMGLGNGLKRGTAAARMSYVTLYPSDNEMDKQSFRELILARTRADLVSAYMANPVARPFIRRIVSAAFVHFMNMLFGMRLRYLTGPFIAKTRALRMAHLSSDGVTILAELRVKLARRGASILEIPFTFRMRTHGSATLFRKKTLVQTVQTILELLSSRT